jgi:hypothetical protein
VGFEGLLYREAASNSPDLMQESSNQNEPSCEHWASEFRNCSVLRIPILQARPVQVEFQLVIGDNDPDPNDTSMKTSGRVPWSGQVPSTRSAMQIGRVKRYAWSSLHAHEHEVPTTSAHDMSLH